MQMVQDRADTESLKGHSSNVACAAVHRWSAVAGWHMLAPWLQAFSSTFTCHEARSAAQSTAASRNCLV